MLGAIRGMAGGKAEAAGAARIGMNQLLEVGRARAALAFIESGGAGAVLAYKSGGARAAGM